MATCDCNLTLLFLSQEVSIIVLNFGTSNMHAKWKTMKKSINLKTSMSAKVLI